MAESVMEVPDGVPSAGCVCVFCGSQRGADPRHGEQARRFGRALAASGLGLVYGGGRVGLMGMLADAVIEAGGWVTGVIPGPLAQKEIAHGGLSELLIVPGMHERKALMAARSRAFVALPGGVGTYEELFEILTWSVLGIHRKPIGLLNAAGYFDPLLGLLEHGVREGFIRELDVSRILVLDDPEALAERIGAHPVPEGMRWMVGGEG
jgi:uncharacterized protein (TIGR00730 family)